MTRWIQSTFTSSIGRKALMAVTGLLLVAFLVIHLLGNLTLYSDVEGEVFTAYARTLHDSGPLLRVAEIGLLVIFLVHIVLGLRVSLQNRDARSQRYRRRVNHGGRTVGSGSMSITGIVVGIFLVIHLRDFWWQVESPEELASMVHARLSQALGALIYIVGVTALWIHLSHGFASAFQTLGVNHPKYNRAIRYTGYGVAAVIGVGFLSFPLYYWLGGNA
jgi:succinate dehydrogenase / fumarate reductase, cytochrome b subunit